MSIPVIALSTVILLAPIATTVVPVATTDAPPVDVTTSPSAMFSFIPAAVASVLIPVIVISKAVLTIPDVVPIPVDTFVVSVSDVDVRNLSSS